MQSKCLSYSILKAVLTLEVQKRGKQIMHAYLGLECLRNQNQSSKPHNTIFRIYVMKPDWVIVTIA